MSSPEYIGISSDGWSLLFSAAQTGAVVFGVIFGLAQLRDLRNQRARASLETMLEEWRRSAQDRDVVLAKLPMHQGSLDSRVIALANDILGHQGPGHLTDVLSSARRVVDQLNDLGGFLERGSVSESDFFGHFHVRILELVYVLEPYILLVTVARGTRWGIRLRRLRTGAERYHLGSTVHRRRDVTVRGVTVLEGTDGMGHPYSAKGRLVPTKEEALPEDDEAIRLAKNALVSAQIDLDRLREDLTHI